MTSPQIAAFAQLGQLWKQVQAEFAESLPVSDPDVLQMVQELLEEETGDVDRIVDLTIDDTDTFRGRAEQRISLGRSQTLQFVISPDRMNYKLVGNVSFGETDEEWAEIIEFAAKTKKKLNCKPGNVQCGGKCQSGQKNCFVDMNSAQKKKAQTATRKAKSVSTPKPGSIAEIKPSEILADPKRFQYKVLGELTKTGEVGSLSGVKKYDPNLAGIIQVWRDPSDNKTYVVNGHNRLALANKLGAESVTVRYLDVKNPKEARAVGALTNIAEGRGDALDAGRFFRDSGITKEELEAKGIPMREKIAQDGLALSKLNDNLFARAIDGTLPIERAAIIGGSGLDRQQQQSLVDLIDREQKRGRRINNDVIKELADTVKASSTQIEEQFDLFGSSEVVVSNAIERASLVAGMRQRISREKRLFNTVGKSKAAEDLSRAGNLIDVEKSRQAGQESGLVLGIFDQLKNVSGPVSNAINQASSRIQNGENSKKVQDDLYRQLVKELPKLVGGK